jgi:hypothetical protein
MADSRAEWVCNRMSALKSERSNFETYWQSIAELTSPMRADFTTQRAPGQTNRMDKVYDGTAGMASENLGAGLWSLVTNAGNKWFALRHVDDDLNEVWEVKNWLEMVTTILLDGFAASGNRFYARAVDLYADLVTFGTAVFFTDWDMKNGSLWCSTRHLAECYIAENERESIDTLFRDFKRTARQLEQMSKEPGGADLPQSVKNALKQNQDQQFPIIHATFPNEDYRPGRLGAKGKPFASLYIDQESRQVIKEGGYEEFPYQSPRWSTRSRSVYGDSPAMIALPDTRMLNAMEKTNIMAAQKAASPPILAPSEDALRGIRTAPDAIIYGAVTEDGKALVQPFNSGANVQLAFELSEQKRQSIREAFYWSLLIMVQQPNMTATEFMGRQEEKMRLMGPYLGRTQSEFLDPLIERSFWLHSRARRLPPMPDILLQNPQIKVEYVSPLARAQKASEAAGVMRATEWALSVAPVVPSVVDVYDWDEMARIVSDANGAPAKTLKDPRAVAQKREQDAQTAQAAMMAEAAPKVATAAKQGAEAAQVMSELPAMEAA